MFMSISSTRCRRPRARSSSASRARLTPSRAATSSRSHACTSCVPAPQRPRSLPRPRLAAAALLVWRRTTLLRTARLRHERGRCAEDAGHDTRVRSMQAMLRADNIAYSMSAVRGIDDIKEKVDEVDKDTCHTVVLLNCGACEDILGMRLCWHRARCVRAPRLSSDGRVGGLGSGSAFDAMGTGARTHEGGTTSTTKARACAVVAQACVCAVFSRRDPCLVLSAASVSALTSSAAARAGTHFFFCFVCGTATPSGSGAAIGRRS